jgi:tRNA(fMet)-specific endonuclease VapC
MRNLYMLDTDICSYIIKGKFSELRQRLISVETDVISISSITEAELLFGVAKVAKVIPKLEQVVNKFLLQVNIEPWGGSAPEHYAAIRANLEKIGMPIGNMDLLIAAHAISLDAVLVTNNMRHFKYVNGLKTEQWINIPAS